MPGLDQQPVFRKFIDELDAAVAIPALAQDSLLHRVGAAAQRLVADDSWLPAAAAVPHPTYYQQYLLYCDPQERYSVVSFVWGIGQSTPIHDHMTWGVIAMLRGSENGRRFAPGRPMRQIEEGTLQVGDIEFVSPTIGDIHQVSNACPDQVSISIHTYGGNIGRIARHVYDPETGLARDFVSGYVNANADTRGYPAFAG